MIWIVLSLAIYSIILSLAFKTENFISSLLFKGFPFILGLGTLLYVIKKMGVL